MTQTLATPNPDDQIQRMLENHERGEFNEVRQVCRELLEKAGPEYRLIALQYLGLSFYQERRYAEALPYLRKVAEEGNDTQDFFNLLMVAVYDRQRFVEEEALARLLPLLAAPSDDGISEGFVRFHYCRALDDMKRSLEAREQLDVLIRRYSALPSRIDSVCAAHGLPRYSDFLRTAEDVFYNLEEGDGAFHEWVSSVSPPEGPLNS